MLTGDNKDTAEKIAKDIGITQVISNVLPSEKTKTIKNDNLCVKVVAEKFIDKENPRVEFRIVTID